MTQKELKQVYIDTVSRDVWPESQHMVDYCADKLAYVVQFEDGSIMSIDKPRIEKDFCFGYSLNNRNTESYDNANDMVTYAANDSDYFMEKNLGELDNMISLLDGTQQHRYQFYLITPFYGQPVTSILKGLVQCGEDEAERRGHKPLSTFDRFAVLEGYRIVREGFVKRLDTYLKKYGLSKVNTWSYWRDE